MANFPCLNESDPVVKKLIKKHGKEKVYTVFIQNGFILPDEINESKELSLDQAKQYLRSYLPASIPVENLARISNLIDEQGIRGNLMGAFLNDTVYLNQTTNVDTAYHEAFHAVFRKLLSTSEQQELLKEGARSLDARLKRSNNTLNKLLATRRAQGLYSNLNDLQAFDRLYEEELAEQFVNFKNNQPTTLLERFFQWLKDLANFFTKDDLAKALFKRIDSGYYADRAFIKNQFDENATPEIAPMLLKYGTKMVELDNSPVVIDQFLSKNETDQIIRMVAATTQYIKDKLDYTKAPLESTIEFLRNRYTVSNEQVEQLAQDKGWSEDEMYDRWDELEDEIKMGTGYRKLYDVFQYPEEVAKIKAATQGYLSNFNIEVDESEEEIEDQNRKDSDYGKEANQFDPFLNGSGFVKGYIGLSYYINPVEKSTLYTYETESGEQTLEVPSIYALDARKVYNGLIRAVNRVGTKEEKLVKMYQFGNLTTGNGLINLSVKHFMDRFLEDTFGNNKNAAIQSLDQGEFPTGLIEQMSVEQAYIFQKIMQAFDLHVLDNDFATIDPVTGQVNVGSANRNSADQNQIDQWRATFYASWYSLPTSEQFKVTSTRAQLADAFRNKTSGFEKRIVDQFAKVGIDLFEDYVALSSEVMHPTGNTTLQNRAQQFGITPENALHFEDFEEIFARLSKNQSPFDNTEEDFTLAQTADNSAASRVKRISKGNALFTEDLFNLGFLRSDGERVYNQQFKNRFQQIVSELKNPLRRQQYKQGQLLEIEPGKWFNTDRYFYQYNTLLHSKNFDTLLDNGGIELSALEGIRQVGDFSSDVGAVFNEMAPREYLVSNLNYFKQGQRKRTVGEQTITTAPVTIGLLETARTMLFFHVPVLTNVYKGDVSELTVNRLGLEIRKEVQRIAQAILDEKLAGAQNYEKGQNVSAFYYDKYGYHIHKFNPVVQGDRKVRAFSFSDTVRYFTNTEMNQLAETLAENAFGAGQEFVEFEGISLTDPMNAHIQTRASALFENFYKDLLASGVVDRSFKGVNSILSSTFYDGTEQGLRDNLGNAFFNVLLNGIAMKQIVVGDPALNYKNDGADPTKRAKSINAAVQSIEHHGNKELGLKPWKHSRVLITQEATVASTYTPGTANTSIADAQMYMSMRALKNTLFGLGKLSPVLSRALDKIDQGESLSAEEVFAVDNGMIARHEMLNPLKLVYRDGHRTLKMSGFTLTKELTSMKKDGVWVARPGYEHLHKMREYMENNDVDFVLNESGTKTLTLNVLYKKNGEYDYNEARPTMFDNSNFGLQLENPSNKVKITEPTQLQRLIDNEQVDDVKVWSEAQGKFVKIKDVKEEYDDFMYSRSAGEFYKTFNELYDVNEAGRDFDQSIASRKLSFSLERFIDSAVESLKASGGDPQLIKLFEEKKNPNIPIMKAKFMQLYMAYFSKAAFSLKTPGHKMTLVSPDGFKLLKQKTKYGWRVVRKDSTEYKQAEAVADYSDLIYVYDEQMEKDRIAEYNAGAKTPVSSFRQSYAQLPEGAYFVDTLRHNVPEYNDQGQITGWYSEVMAPTHFEDLATSPDEQIPINKALGARIPSQDKHSFISMKFVDTIPAYYGSSIVPCKEIIELSGADFDIDSLFVMTEAYYMQDGKPTTYNNLSPQKEFELYLAYELENNKMVGREARKHGISKLDAMKRLRLPTTQQEYAEAKIDLNVETLLKPLSDNKILYSRMNLLNNPYTLVEAKTAIEPATQDKLIAVEKFELNGKRLFEVNGQSIFKRDYSGFPVNSLNYQFNKFRDNTVGKDNIGIAVNGNLIGSELLKRKLALYQDFYSEVDGLELKGFFSYTNVYGTRILDIISTLISAATDEAKDGNNAKYGLSPEALRAVVPMVLMGTRLETAVALVNQPILQEFFELKNLQRASIMTPQEAKEYKYASDVKFWATAKGATERLKIQSVANPLSSDDTSAFGIEEFSKVLRQKKYLELGQPIPEEDLLLYKASDLETMVMDFYMKMAKISELSQTVSSRIKLNGGLPSEINDFKRIISNYNTAAEDEEKPFSITEIASSGLNKAMMDLGEQISTLLPTTFISETSEIGRIRDTVRSNLKRNLNPAELEKIERDIESFVYFNAYKAYVQSKYGVSYEELRRDSRLSLIYKGQLESTIADMYKDILANNRTSALRKLLIPILTTTGAGKTVQTKDMIEGLSFRSISKLQEQELGDISDSILELLVSENPDYRRFGHALWDYFIIKDGFQFRYGTVSKILPTLMFDDLSATLDELQKGYPITSNPYQLVELLGESKEYDQLVQLIRFEEESPVTIKSDSITTFFETIEEAFTSNFTVRPSGESYKIDFPAYIKYSGKLFKLNPDTSDGVWKDGTFTGKNASYQIINQRGSVNASPAIALNEMRPLAIGEGIEHPWFSFGDDITGKNTSKSSKNSVTLSNNTQQDTVMKPSEITNHSGGAIGADSAWEQIGREFGVINHKHYWHGTKTPSGNTQLSDEQIEEGFRHVLEANKTLNRKPDAYKSLLGRNWFQVKGADAVFAIASLKSKTEVNGGTGWAVQMAIDNNKPVYVFDQKTNNWMQWNGKEFVRSETPKLTKNFAGIGTREITESGKNAIRAVYQNTLNSSEDQESQQTSC